MDGLASRILAADGTWTFAKGLIQLRSAAGVPVAPLPIPEAVWRLRSWRGSESAYDFRRHLLAARALGADGPRSGTLEVGDEPMLVDILRRLGDGRLRLFRGWAYAPRSRGDTRDLAAVVAPPPTAAAMAAPPAAAPAPAPAGPPAIPPPVFGKSGLPIPQAHDPKLQNLMNDLYKGTNTPAPIGDGSTMDAIRSEGPTGVTHGKNHTQKGGQYQKALGNWLKKNPAASAHDRQLAKDTLLNLINALNGA
jgi:hypothetical protein